MKWSACPVQSARQEVEEVAVDIRERFREACGRGREQTLADAGHDAAPVLLAAAPNRTDLEVEMGSGRHDRDCREGIP